MNSQFLQANSYLDNAENFSREFGKGSDLVLNKGIQWNNSFCAAILTKIVNHEAVPTLRIEEKY